MEIAVGYIRVSTDDQSLSPAAQRHAIEHWCRGRGLRLVAVEEDLGVSGATPVDKRPGLLRALDTVETHRGTALVIARRDRLARDVLVSAVVERLLARHGATIVSVDGSGNGDSPEAQLMRTLVDAFAQYERALIRARTKSALAARKRAGLRTGRVPYGYRLAEDGQRLEQCPTEQQTIKRALELHMIGMSQRVIAEQLNTEGHRGRNNAGAPTRWSRCTIGALLRRGGQ
jgi:site-specific DNA recombinase